MTIMNDKSMIRNDNNQSRALVDVLARTEDKSEWSNEIRAYLRQPATQAQRDAAMITHGRPSGDSYQS